MIGLGNQRYSIHETMRDAQFVKSAADILSCDTSPLFRRSEFCRHFFYSAMEEETLTSDYAEQKMLLYNTKAAANYSTTLSLIFSISRVHPIQSMHACPIPSINAATKEKINCFM